MASPKSSSAQSAPNISAAELEIKRRGRRRLIGAFTLGLLAIVFLPMIFDSEPKKAKGNSQGNSQEIAIQVPPKDGLVPLSPPVPAPAAPVVTTTPQAAPVLLTPPVASVTAPRVEAKPDATPTGTTSATSAIAPPKPAAVVTMPAPPTVVKEPPKKATTEPKPAPVTSAAAKQGFVIQIGAFKDAANAQQIVARMKESKLPVFTDSIATSGGNVTRVRVGPFSTKEKAETALVQVKLAGSDGKLVPLP